MTGHQKATILIVDDTPSSLKLLFESLRGYGYEVIIFQDGKIALEQAKYARPDLILLDVVMPGLDGFEICRQLKADQSTRDIPVIFITGLAETADEVKGLQIGAVDFIRKPFQMEKVVARLETHLTIRNLNRRLEEKNAKLRQENAGRMRIEEDLRQSEAKYKRLNENLELRVAERTQALQAEVIERKRVEAELLQSHRELMALNTIAAIISQSRNLEHILSAALNEALKLLFAPEQPGSQGNTIPSSIAGCVHLLDKDPNNFSLAVEQGFSPEAVETIKTITLAAKQRNSPWRDTPTLNEGQPGILPENLNVNLLEQLFGPEIVEQAGWQLLIYVPLRVEDEILGLLSIFNKKTGYVADAGAMPAAPALTERQLQLLAIRFPAQQWRSSQISALTERQLQLLKAIGRQISVAIENDRLTGEAAEAEITQEVEFLHSKLIANVSHELRTPLGLIKAVITTLLAEDVELEQQLQQKLLQGINDETDRLEYLVDNLLTLSRMEQKGLFLNRVPTDIGQLAQKTIKAMQSQEASTHFVCNFPPQPLIAYVDATRIEQVLRNLLGNAIKYSLERGTITIEGAAKNNQLLIMVSDQGIGVSPADLHRIFERFFRVENETTIGVRGVGLGLAISDEIVRAHGGRIWAKSELGVGSTFYFTLPLTKKG